MQIHVFFATACHTDIEIPKYKIKRIEGHSQWNGMREKSTSHGKN